MIGKFEFLSNQMKFHDNVGKILLILKSFFKISIQFSLFQIFSDYSIVGVDESFFIFSTQERTNDDSVLSTPNETSRRFVIG